jgi:hypothetical protein
MMSTQEDTLDAGFFDPAFEAGFADAREGGFKEALEGGLEPTAALDDGFALDAGFAWTRDKHNIRQSDQHMKV